MNLLEKLYQTQEFATLPPVAAKILSLLENDDVAIKEIASVIESDPSLTIKLLKLANSPIYAVRSEIITIHQAIITLGLNRLTNIVLGISIFSKFLLSSQHHSIKLMEKFWWHSASTGLVAKSLTKLLKDYSHGSFTSFKEDEFIGGLLHDIGKLAMIQIDSENFLEVIKLVESGMSDTEAELEVFGIDHCSIGFEVSKMWKLPDELSVIIAKHHNLNDRFDLKGIVGIVRIADLFCEIWGADFYEALNEFELDEEIAWTELCKLNPQFKDIDKDALAIALENDFKESSDFLNLIISGK